MRRLYAHEVFTACARAGISILLRGREGFVSEGGTDSEGQAALV